MDALEAIFTRRSTRRMGEEIPPKEVLQQVVEAGRAAPSGSNSQSTRFLVITRKEVLEDLASLVQQEFSQMEIGEDTYVSLRHSITASKKGGYRFSYNAPVLIVVANKKGYGNAMADSACALENMMIAANALDLGSCYINQLHWLDERESIRNYLYKLGLLEDETITGGLILGYGPEGMPVRAKREPVGNPVVWIE